MLHLYIHKSRILNFKWSTFVVMPLNQYGALEPNFICFFLSVGSRTVPRECGLGSPVCGDLLKKSPIAHTAHTSPYADVEFPLTPSGQSGGCGVRITQSHLNIRHVHYLRLLWFWRYIKPMSLRCARARSMTDRVVVLVMVWSVPKV